MNESTENNKATGLNKNIVIIGAAVVVLAIIAVVFFLPKISSTNGVAATVNGKTIAEQDVTNKIEQYRKEAGFDTDDKWAQQLANINQTPETFRETMIRDMAEDIIYEQQCEKNGITVTEEEVDHKVEEAKAYYENYEDYTFEDMLQDSLLTEDGYRDYVRDSLYREKMIDYYKSITIDDATLLEYINSNIQLIDGAKEFSVIVTDSKEKANAARDELARGTDFAKVQSSYSLTTAYDGWNMMPTISDDAVKAANALDKGAVSDIIEVSGTFYIIKCTDILSVPANGVKSVSEIPEKYLEGYKDDILQSSAFKVYSEAMDAAIASADIKINAMPKNLPYDVNMDGYSYQGFYYAGDGTDNIEIEGEDITVNTIGNVTNENVSGNSNEDQSR